MQGGFLMESFSEKNTGPRFYARRESLKGDILAEMSWLETEQYLIGNRWFRGEPFSPSAQDLPWAVPREPTFLVSFLDVTVLKKYRLREPRWVVHCGVDCHNDSFLYMHAKHQCYDLSLWIDVYVVIAFKIRAVFDLKTVLILRAVLLSIFICQEGIAH